MHLLLENVYVTPLRFFFRKAVVLHAKAVMFISA